MLQLVVRGLSWKLRRHKAESMLTVTTSLNDPILRTRARGLPTPLFEGNLLYVNVGLTFPWLTIGRHTQSSRLVSTEYQLTLIHQVTSARNVYKKPVARREKDRILKTAPPVRLLRPTRLSKPNRASLRPKPYTLLLNLVPSLDIKVCISLP